MEEVTLFHVERPDIEICIKLYFTAEGQLILDGYDSGKTVEDYWGRSDYEYSYTIEPEEVDKFYPLFNLQKGDCGALLQALKARFGANNAYSMFGEFMSANNIDRKKFTWP